MSEVMKLPLILGAISTIGGGTKEILPVFREAVSKPFANVWISLAYTFNNLLYFDALSSISAVTYQARAHSQHRSSAAHRRSPRLTVACDRLRQVLSQSKTFFTAGLMRFLVGKKLAPRQLIAVIMLVTGAVLVQFQELSLVAMPTATATAGSIYWACGLVSCPRPRPHLHRYPPPSTLHPSPSPSTHPHRTSALRLGMSPSPRPFASAPSARPCPGGLLVPDPTPTPTPNQVIFSSFISALPNVAYEKVLKTEGQNQWVNNVQVTAWITLWVSLNAMRPYIWSALTAIASGAGPTALMAWVAALPASVAGCFTGFTLSVWGVVLLKALNGILIPATFKYADNLLYSYAKPSSIVVTCLFGAAMARALPPLTMLAGVAIVVTSIGLYNSKPATKTD